MRRHYQIKVHTVSKPEGEILMVADEDRRKRPARFGSRLCVDEAVRIIETIYTNTAYKYCTVEEVT